MAGGKGSKLKVTMAERRAMAVSLRKTGASYRTIAQKIAIDLNIPKYSDAQAVRDVQAELTRLAKEASLDTVQVRQLELERLDQYLVAIARDIQAGDYGAIDRALKICERRSRLLGIDSPIEFKIQELVQTEVTKEINLLFESIASDPDIPAEAKQRMFAKAAQVQDRSSVAGEN